MKPLISTILCLILIAITLVIIFRIINFWRKKQRKKTVKFKYYIFIVTAFIPLFPILYTIFLDLDANGGNKPPETSASYEISSSYGISVSHVNSIPDGVCLTSTADGYWEVIAGKKIELSIIVDDRYELTEVSIKTNSGKIIDYTRIENVWYFIMPDDHVIIYETVILK